MVKTIIFDNEYDEAKMKKVVEGILQWPGAGPQEVSISISGTQFVLTGHGNTKEEFLTSFIAQATALQGMLRR